MNGKICFAVVLLCAVTCDSMLLAAGDWPIYKGNIYYTGNNDEITVKNNNLKWLYQASDMVYNPIISEGLVFFVDLKKNVYCLDEDSGKLKWRINLHEASARFFPAARSAGKVKYPLVQGDRLFLTDNFVVYCLDKRSGRVIWARTGMRDEKDLFDRSSEYNRKTPSWRQGADNWDPTKHSTTLVDGIYSDPVIRNDTLYYGTRRVFIARETGSGHLKWDNQNVQSYSGYPSFYDPYVFTQSMDYSSKTFTLMCLDAVSGRTVWTRALPVPERIFSPVVYRGHVYLPIESSLYCFSLSDGSMLWTKDYGETVTSNPSFTEREILFTTGNRRLFLVDPESGALSGSIDLGERSSPYFVTIRDQIYIAGTVKKRVGDRDLSYAFLRAIRFSNRETLWEFTPPFPGGAYQPAASGGIMFLPAGNYLYAVGTDYYPRVVEGGDAVYDPYNRAEDGKHIPPERKKDVAPEKEKPPVHEQRKTRKMKITVKGDEGVPIAARLEIRKWEQGKPVYSDRITVSRPEQEIMVPDEDDVEITADADGYLPRKEIISRSDAEASLKLDRIEKGREIVVENIHFEINEAYLKKESLNILDRIIDAMKKNEKVKMEVRGHTDSTGTRGHNMKLSERRADAVVEYMVKHGIHPERLVAKGFGPDRPIADNATAEGRRKNRRTEFCILDK